MRAAEQGNADAQLFLARLHIRGEGVEQDDEKAWFWLMLARIHKPSASAYYLDQIRDKISEARREALEIQADGWIPTD